MTTKDWLARLVTNFNNESLIMAREGGKETEAYRRALLELVHAVQMNDVTVYFRKCQGKIPYITGYIWGLEKKWR